jgi:hypothetical protein
MFNPKKDFVNLLKESGFEPYSYSGRGMYDKECVAVNVNNPVEFGFDLAIQIQKNQDCDYRNEMTAIAKTYHQDNMGLGFVIYWPHIDASFLKEEEEKEDK